MGRWIKDYSTTLPIEVMKVRKLSPAGGEGPRPRLNSETVFFRKVSMVVEFLCATSYEDGSPRTPGYLTLRNRGHCYELTAYDPDSGQRLCVGASDLDSCYTALNTMLGADLAPWTLDDYLTGLLSKKRKK